MPRISPKRLRISLYMLLFIAATFAVIHFAFWADQKSVTIKPSRPDAAGPVKPSPARRPQ